MDARVTTFTMPMNGNQIQPILDGLINSIGATSLFYSLETDNGTIAGYFVLLVNISNFSATLQEKQLRPAFFSDSTSVNDLINVFIASNEWQQDILLQD